MTYSVDTYNADIVIAGAGVIGLAIGRALAKTGREIIVIEPHATTGQETSARNSEVIHAGIFYETDSLKAKLCRAGRDRWIQISSATPIDFARASSGVK